MLHRNCFVLGTGLLVPRILRVKLNSRAERLYSVVCHSQAPPFRSHYVRKTTERCVCVWGGGGEGGSVLSVCLLDSGMQAEWCFV